MMSMALVPAFVAVVLCVEAQRVQQAADDSLERRSALNAELTRLGASPGGTWDGKLEVREAADEATEKQLAEKLEAYGAQVQALEAVCAEAQAGQGKDPALRRAASECSRELTVAQRVGPQAKRIFTAWAELRAKSEQQASRFAEPAGKKLAEKVLELPSASTRCDLLRAGAPCWVTNAHRLFELAHPSRFLFLRRETALWYQGGGAERTLRRGEAVLVTKLDRAGGEEVANLVAVDGTQAYVSVDALSPMPISKAPPIALKAKDLDVWTDGHEWLGGPSAFVADDEGFYLEEKPRWLEHLSPPEPRTQQLFDAREKVLECYRKRIEKVDPTGDLRRRFNYVTYDTRTGEVKKMERAAVKLDRDACAACACKKFNALKAKLAVEALTPLQQRRYDELAPAITRVNGLKFEP